MKRTLTVAVGDAPALRDFLAARLALTPAACVALLARGAVFVDGRRCQDGARALAPGGKIRVLLADDDAAAAPPPLRVAYEDTWLLVADKPAGLLSQAAPHEETQTLERLVQAREPEARMLHRLDRDASGLVLFARVPAARAPLQALLEGKAVARSYVALVAGTLVGEGEIRLRIGRAANDPRRRVALPEQDPSGESARSRYRAVESAGDVTRVELTLDTGRTHQLRVHLAALGHPILGDVLYHGPAHARLALHAARLALTHPQSRRAVVVESPPPEGLALSSVLRRAPGP